MIFSFHILVENRSPLQGLKFVFLRTICSDGADKVLLSELLFPNLQIFKFSNFQIS
jgi:hypothetical protein